MRPNDHVFVDESKSGGYFLAAVSVEPTAVVSIEASLRKLRAPRRSSIHFNDESKRRASLLREFVAFDVRSTVYVMRNARDVVARPSLMRVLVDDVVEAGASRIVLERDESVERRDRRVIRDALLACGADKQVTYEHRQAREQPMLWIADAIAWCHQKRGEWIPRVAPIVSHTVRVDAP